MFVIYYYMCLLYYNIIKVFNHEIQKLLITNLTTLKTTLKKKLALEGGKLRVEGCIRNINKTRQDIKSGKHGEYISKHQQNSRWTARETST